MQLAKPEKEQKNLAKFCLLHPERAGVRYLSSPFQFFLLNFRNKPSKAFEEFLKQSHWDPHREDHWKGFAASNRIPSSWKKKQPYCANCYQFLNGLLLKGFSYLESQKILFHKEKALSLFLDAKRLERFLGQYSQVQKNIFKNIQTFFQNQNFLSPPFQIQLHWSSSFQQVFTQKKNYNNQNCPYTGVCLEKKKFDWDHIASSKASSQIRADPFYNQFMKKTKDYSNYLPHQERALPFFHLILFLELISHHEVDLALKPTGPIERQLCLYSSFKPPKF